MIEHLDEDRLVSLGSAIDWQVDEVLEHLAACEACRETLRDLVRIRTELARADEPEPAFADRVLRAVRDGERARDARRNRWLAPLNPALAAVTTVFAVRLGVSSVPGIDVGWVLAVAGAAAAATWWWERRAPESVVAG